ncbi:MAG TPA: membrane protein insertase YidC [Gemmatimonadaceae bacterium]|jgi:YidC/Oxa1 family membrane protein insertase|nr:membrane protein insertase YidC [Gemmatimonadaceae bacterium]
MDNKRFWLALALSVATVFVVQKLFPTYYGHGGLSKTIADAMVAPKPAPTGAPETSPQNTPSVIPATGKLSGPVADSIAAKVAQAVRAETTIVIGRPDSGAQYVMSSVGATPISVVMNAFANRSRASGKVNLAMPGMPVLKYQLIANQGAAVDLSATPFSVTQQGNTLTYQTGATPTVPAVSIQYLFAPDSYTVHVSGMVTGAKTGDLVVNLPTTFPMTEADTADDRNYLAYAYYSKREGAKNIAFRSLDPGEQTPVVEPLQWVAAKSKYFVVGLLAPKNGSWLSEATFVGGARTSKVATNAAAAIAVPIHDGTFAFDLYTGPQSLRRLEHLGRNFDEVNPYGWAFFRSVMQPIAFGVTRLVLWMHERLSLSYGLVVVLLGVLVRLVLWPLNQGAMRSSLKMQDLQPKLQSIQNKYKDNPEKQRTEIMKVYSEHGMSPLSPLLGCLPMLLPMPVLFALYFVFRNTIEFRGVSFLWLTDLSSRDPYFILPVIMGISMFLLSWIGMRNSPPNPQAKMMGYMMPVMFVVFLVRAASGLNLYYAVQNLAALPQQWLLARERAKRGITEPLRPPTPFYPRS